MEKLFEIKNLNMRFPVTDGLTGNITGYIHALNGINLDIKKNEILALAGESGSGKSTLGNCILRLLEPSSGEVLFKGVNILKKTKKELKSFRRAAQPVFQNPYMSLNPRMKIYDILKEPFIVHNIKEGADERIIEVIKAAGLNEEILKQYPHEFSGGQRQRIAIARAVMLYPEFIAADEPVSALDVSIQAQIINLLKDLRNRLNLSMLFISHDLSVIKYIADRTAVMYLGEIAETAPSEEFFKNCLHPYSQALLASVPMFSERGITKKTVLEGAVPSPLNLPEGCKFAARCPRCMPECTKKTPELKEILPEHKVRCLLYE